MSTNKQLISSLFAQLLKNITPAISKTLANTNVNAPEVDPLNTIMDLANRQYDLPLIEEAVSNSNDGAYALDDYFDQGIFESLAPSSDILDLQDKDLENFSLDSLDSMGAHAAASAKSMLLNTEDSPLKTRALLQPDLSLNERINSKAADARLGILRNQTSNPENEIFAALAPQAAVDANFDTAKVLGVLPPNSSYEDDKDIKKRMYRMLTTGKIWF